jgi:hypothetical protein
LLEIWYGIGRTDVRILKYLIRSEVRKNLNPHPPHKNVCLQHILRNASL